MTIHFTRRCAINFRRMPDRKRRIWIAITAWHASRDGSLTYAYASLPWWFGYGRI
jgi:hypothetical protein